MVFDSSDMPSGTGGEQLLSELRRLVRHEANKTSFAFMYGTIIDKGILRIDQDGYSLYAADGDYLVLKGATFSPGDRVVCVPVQDPLRGTILVLGSWNPTIEVQAKRVSTFDLAVQTSAIADHVHAENGDGGGTTDSPSGSSVGVSSIKSVIFNRNWFPPNSLVTLKGRGLSAGAGTVGVSIDDATEGNLYSNADLSHEEEFSVSLTLDELGDSNDNVIKATVTHDDALTGYGGLEYCMIIVEEP